MTKKLFIYRVEMLLKDNIACLGVATDLPSKKSEDGTNNQERKTDVNSISISLSVQIAKG